VLEIGRANRPDLYNLSYEKPVPFVPRRHRIEVAERMSYRGDVISALDEEELRSVARTIEGIEPPKRTPSPVGTSKEGRAGSCAHGL